MEATTNIDVVTYPTCKHTVHKGCGKLENSTCENHQTWRPWVGFPQSLVYPLAFSAQTEITRDSTNGMYVDICRSTMINIINHQWMTTAAFFAMHTRIPTADDRWPSSNRWVFSLHLSVFLCFDIFWSATTQRIVKPHYVNHHSHAYIYTCISVYLVLSFFRSSFLPSFFVSFFLSFSLSLSIYIHFCLFIYVYNIHLIHWIFWTLVTWAYPKMGTRLQWIYKLDLPHSCLFWIHVADLFSSHHLQQ